MVLFFSVLKVKSRLYSFWGHEHEHESCINIQAHSQKIKIESLLDDGESFWGVLWMQMKIEKEKVAYICFLHEIELNYFRNHQIIKYFETYKPDLYERTTGRKSLFEESHKKYS